MNPILSVYFGTKNGFKSATPAKSYSVISILNNDDISSFMMISPSRYNNLSISGRISGVKILRYAERPWRKQGNEDNKDSGIGFIWICPPSFIVSFFIFKRFGLFRWLSIYNM